MTDAMLLPWRAARLRRVTLGLLDASRPPRGFGLDVRVLTDILRECAAYQHVPSADIAAGETRTDNGLALSPRQAAMCADDVARTVAFIRGLHDAILEARAKGSRQPRLVLYAGCGPYATLAAPLMSVFSPDDVTFTLLDIHQQSLDSARAVVAALGFTQSVTRYELADAAHYEIPASETPDVVLAETMRACLQDEPQVAVVRHLLRQAPAAVLVPQSVRIDARLVDTSKEFGPVDSEREEPFPRVDRDRVLLGTVFELNAETVRSWPPEWTQRVPGSTIRIPDPKPEGYDPFLFTTVTTYGDHQLADYDSGLTVPRPFPGTGVIRGGETLEFSYRLGPHPALLFTDVHRPPRPSSPP